MMENKSSFLDTIFQLRKDGSMTIFSDLKTISEKEEKDAEIYFESEFEKERLGFLSDQIAFDKKAAVWAAKVLYHSAQLYLIRKDTSKNLDQLIPHFNEKQDVSAILSADLSLRFLPQIVVALRVADPEDILLKILEGILLKYHYSGVGFDLNLENINWEVELQDKTYRKLYLERIVEKKAYQLAEIPYINHLLIAEFGIYKDVFWKELKIVNK
ncbi:hypothetical protein CHRY9390_00752 [Chryseobacterium aquaeductus]|uniref:MoxR-vWA-beta-propeller ternary system domain-containing protein n=1 Tax=Chryseobacterium aquaeductus TaxID=2675056 RepID=A0A9N8MED9_9FLAO|nr:hypothetical protein [Chryseobacterium aquaeductus]CAA7330099.1 hypothetical protein CHRY9390_00752 [Chryseobacterium potabilaquae]CAD7801268.1 hypothetical protein CHRY9390_00752 [Chryseobacterium aquaeductus]